MIPRTLLIAMRWCVSTCGFFSGSRLTATITPRSWSPGMKQSELSRAGRVPGGTWTPPRQDGPLAGKGRLTAAGRLRVAGHSSASSPTSVKCTRAVSLGGPSGSIVTVERVDRAIGGARRVHAAGNPPCASLGSIPILESWSEIGSIPILESWSEIGSIPILESWSEIGSIPLLKSLNPPADSHSRLEARTASATPPTFSDGSAKPEFDMRVTPFLFHCMN